MSTAFSADWLALREPADLRARSVRLTQQVVRVLGTASPLRVLDLAAGTGANARYLTRWLPPDQEWLLIDRDEPLLDRARAQTLGPASLETRTIDLALAAADHRDLDGLFTGRALVTASALLDLVSHGWLEWLGARCQAERAAVLFTLTYDGRIRCSPGEPEDSLVCELVNRHQRTDKGFGTSLGPDAVDSAEDVFTRLGYQVERDSSDWMLSGGSEGLQRALIEGWGQAAIEMAPGQSSAIRGWAGRRLEHVNQGRSQIVVGHADLAGWVR